MRGNIGQMMKQAQMMQENMRRMQEQLGTIEVEGLSGSGMVKRKGLVVSDSSVRRSTKAAPGR